MLQIVAWRPSEKIHGNMPFVNGLKCRLTPDALFDEVCRQPFNSERTIDVLLHPAQHTLSQGKLKEKYNNYLPGINN